MKDTTVIHVVGNRPQFIKLAVLYNTIARETSLSQFIIHTGQHSSEMMSDIFFDELLIPSPDVLLNLDASTPGEFIGKASAEIHSVLSKRQDSDLVLVYGDTNSTLAAALAARRSGHKLFHFESGVRTNDNAMPEEINRILTDRLSAVHYCCTENNKQNLINEGYGAAIPSEVLWTGDLMLDAFLHIAPSDKNIISTKKYIACTIHRAANISDKKNLQQIVSALNEIHGETEVVIPLHPHTRKRLKEFGIDLECTIIDPLAYKEMKRFIMDADLVITDSGGACREAFFAGKKSLIIMEHPFWPEIIRAGAALNSGPDKDAIINSFNQVHRLQPQFDINIFGDGNAAKIIAKHLNALADKND